MLFTLAAHLVVVTGQFYADSASPLLIGPPPMIKDDIDPNCWNFTYGNWRIQEFYTPNYPGEYLNTTDCVLYLEAPPGFKIQLDFRDKFMLEKSDGCKYDYLEVRDGPFAYSPLISRYCGAEFPPIITSTGRFLWLRFKTDDILQYGGFRAIYSYHKDHTQNDGAVVSRATSSTCRIPVKLSPDEADGVLSADDIPYADLHDLNVSKGQPVDCTWEIHTDKGHGINLRSSELELRNRKRCDVNITVYERTTLDSSIKGKYCQGNEERVDMTSASNRVFVRLYGSSISNKPNVKMIYTLVRKGECSETEFHCFDLCLPLSLKCNGVDNCRDKSDERGCTRGRKTKDRTPVEAGADTQGVVKRPISDDGGTEERTRSKEHTNDSSIMPFHIIILASVGGVIITCVSISLCVMCILRKKDREKRQDTKRPKNSQKNALEMAVCNSSNTTISLSRQNNEGQVHKPAGGGDRQHYVTFSKLNAPSPPTGIDDPHRYSMTDRGMAPTDPDAIPEQMTESGNYKRFLAIDITPEDIIEESLQQQQQQLQGKYVPPPAGVVGMTNLDHRVPDVYQNYHGNQWHPNLSTDGIMYSYGSSSLNRPTPFLGLSKQYSYNQPETKYESKYLKALKTMENDSIKEYQSS